MHPVTTLESYLRDRVIAQGDCWLAQGVSKHHGYKQVKVNRVRYAAHRWVYEQMRGPVPDGLELDHLCRNTSCVNPDHLEPVTHAENSRRRMLEKCGRGHDLTLPNARYVGHTKSCRRCAQIRAAERAARLKRERAA